MKLLVQVAELHLNSDLLIAKPVLGGNRLESWVWRTLSREMCCISGLVGNCAAVRR